MRRAPRPCCGRRPNRRSDACHRRIRDSGFSAAGQILTVCSAAQIQIPSPPGEIIAPELDRGLASDHPQGQRSGISLPRRSERIDARVRKGTVGGRATLVCIVSLHDSVVAYAGINRLNPERPIQSFHRHMQLNRRLVQGRSSGILVHDVDIVSHSEALPSSGSGRTSISLGNRLAGCETAGISHDRDRRDGSGCPRTGRGVRPGNPMTS